MLPDESSLTTDTFGFPMIMVSRETLTDFPALISWIRYRGYGRHNGLVKLRLRVEDRNDDECLKEILGLMKEAFKRTIYDEETKTTSFEYNPSVQVTHKASASDHIYQYSKVDCTAKERKTFVENSVKARHYHRKNNSCSKFLETGAVDDLRNHLYSELKMRSRIVLNGSEDSDVENMPLSKRLSTIPVYEDGIVLDKETKISICQGFSMSSGLDTILGHLTTEYDGISCPYYYVGDKGTLFPWHIEDGGLFSINYVFKGFPKFWFGISPDYYGLVDKISSGVRMDLGHTCCRALLADHKALVADPEFFHKHFKVPYCQVIQEPGDFIITLPFALHAGFNLGINLSTAANFASSDWIELGMYAPICPCNPLQVQFDLSGIIQKFRPELLDIYENSSALVFPRNHPREVRYPEDQRNTVEKDIVPQLYENKESGNKKIHPATVQQRMKMKAAFTFTQRTLHCPACNQTFENNKLDRLTRHITNHHPEQKEELLRIAACKYPKWEPKMTKGSDCPECKTFIRGDRFNMAIHINNKHNSKPDASLSFL